MLALLVPAGDPWAGTPSTVFEKLERAEAEFDKGVSAREHPEQAKMHFRAAMALYADLRCRGVDSVGLCHNLGNAALLAGELPTAILAYRHGLRLTPADPVLRGNLEEARDQVVYPPGTLARPAPDSWPRWLPRPGESFLLLSAWCVYGLGCIAVTRWLMGRAPLAVGVSALLLAAGLAAAWSACRWQDENAVRQPLIVVAADEVPLRTGNGRSYPPQRALPLVRRGMEGRRRFVRGDWLQVEFPGGQVGWVERRHVLVDE
jgi:hypothetical protein